VTRPRRLVLVVGTGTEIGKTWVAARLLEAWRADRISVAARKPAQSGEPGSAPSDAEVLGAASGEDPAVVCLAARSYSVALAPPMAADALGLATVALADLVAELRWPDPPVDVGLVETAGGLRSPQAHDGDARELAAALRPDVVVLVAHAGLGTINAVRLCTEALVDTGLPVRVVLNRYDAADALHKANRTWLTERDQLDVTPGTPDGLAALAARLAAPR
jgi:dethiobiotin synthetase